MRLLAAIGLVLAVFGTGGPAAAQPAGGFSDFVARFEAKAVAAGVARAVYYAATRGLTPDPRTPDLIETQPEFTTPIWDYLDKRVSADRVARGRKAFQDNRALFARIGQRFGIDPFVLAAIWGMETDYGAVLGNHTLIRPVVRSLMTLAWRHRLRWQADEAELIAALKLIAYHGWTEQSLVGSWAGAIGHTQVIVSGLLRYGTDGDGDGRIDPQRSLADALATTANYLSALGYRPGEDWGYEVTVPDGFDLLLADRDALHPIGFFTERGIGRVKGRDFGDPGQQVFLYLPAGVGGPKFLMTRNYLVLKDYNFSDSYALAVAHLTDRLKGGGALVHPWPRRTGFPDLLQRESIQRRLGQLGFYDGPVDGRIGPASQRAFQMFQAAKGLPADGFITKQALGLLGG
jgi:peptidoglycan lytic transglycosylase B